MINYAYVSKDESEVLMHYGVMGMKWGVRRYQPVYRMKDSLKYYDYR